jgi:hypothetical protein
MSRPQTNNSNKNIRFLFLLLNKLIQSLAFEALNLNCCSGRCVLCKPKGQLSKCTGSGSKTMTHLHLCFALITYANFHQNANDFRLAAERLRKFAVQLVQRFVEL